MTDRAGRRRRQRRHKRRTAARKRNPIRSRLTSDCPDTPAVRRYLREVERILWGDLKGSAAGLAMVDLSIHGHSMLCLTTPPKA